MHAELTGNKDESSGRISLNEVLQVGNTARENRDVFLPKAHAV